MSDLLDRSYRSVRTVASHALGAGTCGLIGGVIGALLTMPFVFAGAKVDVLTKPWWIGAVIGVIAYALTFADD